jgi:hypothetical protein
MHYEQEILAWDPITELKKTRSSSRGRGLPEVRQ